MIPKSARLLGFAGLLPALGAILVAIFHDARDMQLFGAAVALAYGGLILSFIGGAWWGLAAQQQTSGSALSRALVLSVLPSLYAWGALSIGWIIADYAFSALLISGGFAATLLVDRWLSGQGKTPQWWLTLRVPLSAAMALLYLSLAAKTYI